MKTLTLLAFLHRYRRLTGPAAASLRIPVKECDTTGVMPVEAILAAPFTMKKSLAQLILLAKGVMFILCIVPASAQERFIVTVGQDKAFTTFNYSDSSFSNDPNNPLPWPDPRTASVNGNTATASLSASPGHAGQAEAHVGILFQWDLAGMSYDQVKDTPVQVIINCSYNIAADWTSLTGSANAGISDIFTPGGWVDRIGFGAGQAGSRGTALILTNNTTVAGLDSIGGQVIVNAGCQAHSAEWTSAVNRSSATVTVNSIQLHFPITAVGHVYCLCDGSPVSGATVLFGDYSATTDSTGGYAITNVPPDIYSVVLSKDKYQTTNAIVLIPGDHLIVTNDFQLMPLYRLDYFGIGVDWEYVTTPPLLNDVRGDLDAINLYSSLHANPSLAFGEGVIVRLDATATSADNLSFIKSRFGQFRASLCNNDTIMFYASSHGNQYAGFGGAPGYELMVSFDYQTHLGLTELAIVDLLKELPEPARIVVILDACHSAGIASVLAIRFADLCALVASSPNGTTPSALDGTGVFTDYIIKELDLGVYDLNQMANDITSDNLRFSVRLFGQDLALRDSGSAIFTGLHPQLWKGSGFTGNLTNLTVNVTQSPPRVGRVGITNGSFEMTLTSMPTGGFVAFETSSNLVAWLQVAFYPATGTNLTVSFPTTNSSCAFFRTRLVP